MSAKEKPCLQRQKGTKEKFKTISGPKLKTKMATNKAFLSLSVSPEISVTRQTDAKPSLRFSSSLKIKEKTSQMSSTHKKIQQSKDTSVYTQEDAGPGHLPDEEGPLKNAPAGRKEKRTQCEVKQRVLRTISRMLQENRIIREQ